MCMLTGKPGQEARLPKHCPCHLIRRRSCWGGKSDAARAAAILFALCGVGRAQDVSDSGSAERKQPSEQIIEVMSGDRITMHVAGLPLSDAVRMLSEPTKRNIILADGVKGTVTASLYNVDFEEALKAMLVSNKLGFRADGDFIYVYPMDELAKIAEAQRKVGSRIFKLGYVNAAAIKPLIEPMLSRIG